MTNRMSKGIVVGPMLLIAMLVVGCGSAATPTSTATDVPDEEIDESLTIEATRDLEFTPNTISAEPGEIVQVTVENTGPVPHTFSIARTTNKDEVLVDAEIEGGGTREVEIVMPEEETNLYLYCDIHESQGMIGAVGVGVTPEVPAPQADATPPPQEFDGLY